MNNIQLMRTADIYQHLRTLPGTQYNQRHVDRLVEMFHRSAKYLINKIETEGWTWRDNYLREHAGCAFGAKFTNTVSPYINELLFRQHPYLQKYRSTKSTSLP